MVSLLPPSATALERALSLAKQHDQLATLCDAPQNVRVDPPASFVPWLLAEYGLADFIDYFDDHRALLNQGKAWVVVRGTGAAVHQALGWVGIDAMLEEDGWRLQIDPGHESAIAQLKAILHLASRSTPAHVQLYRLYHGYDRRRLMLDHGRFDDHLLDDDSGVWQDGVKVSFGRDHRLESGLNAPAGLTDATLHTTRAHASHTLYPDVLRYGTARFGDAPVINNPWIRGHLVCISNAASLENPITLRGLRRIARASFTLSEDFVLGEPNTRFGSFAETAENRFLLSAPESKLSDFNFGRIRTAIEEVFIEEHIIAAVAPLDLGDMAPYSGNIRSHSIHTTASEINGITSSLFIDRLHVLEMSGIGERAGQYGWTGPWDSRRWTGDIGTTHQTLTS